ncbi:MAG: putative electron transfer oxidoreductase [Pedosphaera sp.]|nr:putative electron transfer oxidoreductase [Pedosphaera sp.]
MGGGLAGLMLGIGLRQNGIPVKVWESGHYPRHRVCGEFISGRGQDSLARLGLLELLKNAGAIPAKTAAFFSEKKSSPVRELSLSAISLSRHVLDNLLAQEFRRLGGELREGERWHEADFAEGVVRANGRRMQAVENGWRWFGLKAHARNVELTADLEMHVSPSGYVGICRLANDEVNVCGLFRRSAESGDARKWPEILRGAVGSLRQQRLAGAKFDEDSFCSVAGLSLRPRRAVAHKECCVGDALTMIPPVTGNGMSMAFESAEVAIEPLVAYGREEMPWAETQQLIARRCDKLFERRLAWAGRLQWMMFAPGLQNALVSLVPRSEWLWQMLFKQTR